MLSYKAQTFNQTVLQVVALMKVSMFLHHRFEQRFDQHLLGFKVTKKGHLRHVGLFGDFFGGASFDPVLEKTIQG